MKVQKTLATPNVLRLSDEKMKAACKGFPFIMKNPPYHGTAACLGSVSQM